MTIGEGRGNFLRSFPAPLQTSPLLFKYFRFYRIPAAKFPGIWGRVCSDQLEYVQFTMTSTGSGRHWFSLLLIPSEKIFHNERFDSPVDFSCLLARSISFQYNGGIYESDLLGGSMLARFLPQTVPFFKLLMEQNAVLQRMAQSLIVVMENTYESEGHLKQINILEEEADKLNRKITWHLSQTFITPIDREDIHAINLAQERVADGIQNLASRFFMCGFMYQRFPAHMMTRNIKGMIEETELMLGQLEKKKDVSGHLHSLKSRKSDCEMLQAAGISEMMDSEIPNFEKVRELILWSQVYERIERAVDMVSDLGDTLEEVVLKYV